jgi:RNA polymerase sigma-70 factor (ECF subfamily)
VPTFESIYEAHFEFVWRTVRRLGVPEAYLDDAVQDVFVVVHRRLGDFAGRSSVKTWLFAIARRTAKDHRRRAQRKPGDALPPELPDAAAGPEEAASRREAARRLQAVLDAMDEEKREVFVLAELEQLAAPAIAEALELPVNTVYSRLRAARAQFNELCKKVTR